MKVIIVFIIVLFTLGACKSKAQHNESANADAPFGDVTAQQAKEIKSTNPEIIFLDVRTPGEISSGKIDGAVEIDFRANNFKDQLNTLDKDKEYIVYCRSGGRSKNAQGIMKTSGFKSAKNMLGGYTSWAK